MADALEHDDYELLRECMPGEADGIYLGAHKAAARRARRLRELGYLDAAQMDMPSGPMRTCYFTTPNGIAAVAEDDARAPAPAPTKPACGHLGFCEVHGCQGQCGAPAAAPCDPQATLASSST